LKKYCISIVLYFLLLSLCSCINFSSGHNWKKSKGRELSLEVLGKVQVQSELGNPSLQGQENNSLVVLCPTNQEDPRWYSRTIWSLAFQCNGNLLLISDSDDTRWRYRMGESWEQEMIIEVDQ